MDLATIITSAAVGAIIAATINLIGAWFERRARRKELLLRTAVELAIERQNSAIEIWKTGRTGNLTLRDPGETFAEYYRIVDHALRHGDVPPDVKESVATQQAAIDGKRT